ncbi:RND transporter [Alcanivorax sp. N3-2A]|nr:RND transporter [Alcanivorax sp. N3-2A]|tara:strand:+ start:43138 stop:44562 length:1425 start_codon:yes stop_codon:yes gene_type:complete
MRNVLTLTAAALLAACAVGPDYRAPEPQAPAAFSEARSARAFDADVERRFWAGFGDPLLAGLIRQTLDANNDLQVALARYDRARALLSGARREQLPSVTASASAAEQHLAEVERTPPGGGDERVELYQAGAGLSWELDLFGRLRRATEARRAELGAAGADLQGVRVALVGQLASSYFELRGLQQQLAVARHNVQLQSESLEIVDARLQAGRGTEFDTVRARARLDATRAAVPELEASIRANMHRIAVLSGQAPTALVDTLAVAEPLPPVMPEIPLGTPGEVLRRRPDIRAAERRLAAATASIGIATADLYPRFTLGGLIGSVAADGDDLFTGGAESRRIALGVDWTFLDFGKVRARIDAADADSRAALANYQQTVLNALEETETLLVRYHRDQTRTGYLASAAAGADRAAQLARERYREGIIGYFEVLAAEQERIDTRDALIQSRTRVTLGMVNLYRALAGAPDQQVEPQQNGA